MCHADRSTIATSFLTIRIFRKRLSASRYCCRSSSWETTKYQCFQSKEKKQYPASHSLSYVSNTTCRKTNIQSKINFFFMFNACSFRHYSSIWYLRTTFYIFFYSFFLRCNIVLEYILQCQFKFTINQCIFIKIKI